MKKWKLFICLLMAWGSSSCQQQKEVDYMKSKHILVAQAIKSPSEIKASDYFQSIEYIPLEITNECPIADNSKVRLLKEKILIYNTAFKQCFLFDRKTGQFLCSIGHIGNDPESVSYIVPWLNYEKDLICLGGWKNVLQLFKSDGSYQGGIKIPDFDHFRAERDFLFLQDSSIIQYYSRFGSTDRYLRFFKNKTTTNKINIPIGDSIVPTIKDLYSVTAVNGTYSGEEDKDYGVRYYSPRNINEISLEYFKQEEVATVDIRTSPFWQTGNNYYFKENYNDTIFQIKETSLYPAFILDLGNQHWDKADCFKWKKDKSILVTNILDCNNFLLVSCVIHPFDYEGFESYNILWNKNSGHTIAAPIKDGITNDIYPFMNLHLLAVSPEGDFADMIPAEDILEWFTMNDTTSLPDNIKTLRNLKEDDNPVVVIMKTKE